jgi:ABC-type methionine transport system ATPase subunit
MYGITIVIVTHDVNVMYKVDRVVTIRDGRSSMEAVRMRHDFTRPGSNSSADFVHFVLLDKAGRLQLPMEYIEKLKLQDKIRVVLTGDTLTIYPEQNGCKENK